VTQSIINTLHTILTDISEHASVENNNANSLATFQLLL